VQIDDLLHDLDLVTQGMSHVYMSLCDFKAQYLHIRNQMYPGDKIASAYYTVSADSVDCCHVEALSSIDLKIASSYYTASADSVDCCHVEALSSIQYQGVETPYYEQYLPVP
jgi:hypothetical protein